MRRTAFVAGSLALLAAPRSLAAGSFARRMHSIVSGIPATTGVFACTLASESPIFSWNSVARFPSASIIKLVIMLTAFSVATSRPGALSERIRIRQEDVIGGSPFLAGQPDNASFSVLQLIRPMIQLSDNTAANALITHFGFAEINRVGAQAGLAHTHLRRHFLDAAAIVRHEENITCPQDMGHLLYQLELGAHEDIETILPAHYCRESVQIMLGQTDREGIPAGVPGIPVANKTGAIDQVRNDVGIVQPFGNEPFVLAILTKDLNDIDAAYTGMQRMARTVYHEVQNNPPY